LQGRQYIPLYTTKRVLELGRTSGLRFTLECQLLVTYSFIYQSTPFMVIIFTCGMVSLVFISDVYARLH
jgi:hypothetical protein